ncbi:MAG: GAF domain-containing protein [Leptospiraceae bacterium]|nr:GAF domain-containing protein [Leptospiraceae bacterium]MDW8306999.1 GAF domain-containing protein [Leptospiraceae bacterium]
MQSSTQLRRRYLALANAATIINADLELPQVLHLIMLSAKDILEAEACSLFLLDHQQNILYCEVALGERGEILRQFLRLELGHGIAGWVAKEREAVMIEDAYQDPRFDPEWDKKSGFRTRSLICVPMFLKSRLIGTLEVINKIHGTTFTSDDLEILTHLADVAAVSIENARLRESLRKKVMELTIIYEFEHEMAIEQRLDVLGEWVLDKCLSFLEAKVGTIYLLDDKENILRILSARGLPRKAYDEIVVPVGEGIAGWVARERKAVLVQDLPSDPRYNKYAKYTYETDSLISAPLLVGDKLIGVISINNKKNGFAFTHSDLSLLETIAARLALTIRHVQLHQELYREKEDRERARRLIQNILPAHVPQKEKCEIAFRYIPYSEVGGDYYTFYEISPTKLGILVVDVSGHGISAAMVAIMANMLTQTFDRAILERPSLFLQELNELLLGRTAGNFLTASYAVIDLQDMMLRYGNAGHVNALLAEKEKREVITLEAAGKLLGVFRGLIYSEKERKLNSSRLVFYTDGLLELSTPDKSKMYTEEELRQAVIETLSLPPQEACDEIIRIARSSCERKAFDDDVTLVIVDVMGGSPP